MKDRDRPPTISQVASAAGVDRSSVSRAFSHPELLSAETVATIKAVAERLGYAPNRSARALSTGRTGNLALIVPDVANPFFPPLIRAAQVAADRADFCLFLGNTDEDAHQEDRLLKRFAGQVDGAILVSPHLSDDRIKSHAERIPLVVINRDVPDVPRVLIDSAPGIAEAVAHLADCGHRRLAYVGGPAASWSNKQRRSAVKKAAVQLCVELLTISTQGTGYEAGQQAVAAAIEGHVTGILTFDDVIAQGVMAGLAARGLRVPRDIAVVACDDILGPATYPRLTTISNRSAEAGKTGIDLMIEMLRTRAVRDVRYVLGTHLTVGMTTVAPGEPTPTLD